jgi:leader peptidase (prepilin peptidase)/N-methyltransferase
VELLAALLFAALFLRQGHDLRLMGVGAVLSLYLLIIAFIDIQHQIIPNELSLSLLILGILASPIHPLLGPSPWPRALNALLGGTVGFSLMLSLAYLGEFLWKKEALGGGDIKLMAALGTFLGWRGIFVTLFLGSLFGALWALSMMAFRRMAKGSYLPFGPFLALGAWMCWIFLDRLDEIWPY